MHSKDKVELGFNNIILTTSYEEAGQGADLVIEAIAEDPEQKNTILSRTSKAYS